MSDDCRGPPVGSGVRAGSEGGQVIDSFTADGTGWARFSNDRIMRHRLARNLTPDPASLIVAGGSVYGIARVVFLMLNPSTADAFQLDPTVNECR